MANHKKAAHHHAKAGEALKKGDLKAAASHMGHALSACRNPGLHDEDTGMDLIPSEDANEMAETAVPVATPSLRSRLSNLHRRA